LPMNASVKWRSDAETRRSAGRSPGRSVDARSAISVGSWIATKRRIGGG
jgi:hypothetical protein